MNNKVLRHDINCRLCGSKNIKDILELKPTPPGDLFLPKSKIELSSEKLYKDKPKYTLVLAWQHQDSIIKRNKKYLNNGGKLIIPLPELKIVE